MSPYLNPNFDMTAYNSPNNMSSIPDYPGEESTALEEKLMVAVRIRPLPKNEMDRCLYVIDSKKIVVEETDKEKEDVLRQKRAGQKRYMFDVVFGEDSTQDELYEKTTKSLVQDILVGYNATVFAYGATGSGKTHTMVGHGGETGIMVRAISDLFDTVAKNSCRYTVKLSYLEIYNENIRDLLNPSSGFLELREDSSRNRNIQVAGLSEVIVVTVDEVMELLNQGNRQRTVEPTGANKTSSRSHALLSVTVSKSSRASTAVRQGRLFMIDLAGSERASHTKNRGKRLKEGAHINRSLLALGNCINALSGGTNPRFVNYRDSKLTRLLRESLSGNCRTVMIAHVNPATIHKDETRNTLIYAARANGISHKVERNVLNVSFQVNQYRSVIADLRNEITRLRTKLDEGRVKSSIGHSCDTPVNRIRDQIVSTFREQMKLRRKLMDIDGHLLSLGVEAERQHQIISQWESRNNKLYCRRMSDHRRPGTRTSSSTAHYSDNEQQNMHQAWSDLSYIEHEQERYVSLRSKTVTELDAVRQQAVALENNLPKRLDSETERELLSLICRVHELEADKMALQGERLVESYELRRRGDLLYKMQKQQRITDDIITKQRQIIEGQNIPLPMDLKELYRSYQQEIHSNSYNADVNTIPLSTIHSVNKSNESIDELDWDKSTKNLPPISQQASYTREEGPSPVPASVLFPPISARFR
ncbi:kinesin-like protein KIF19 isoform X2 [Daktulosphaira vitifoliae]|uniref:kinesin-like protein KIF19 isoform X2 n=1 Tax=Daktulosphaira vitifoliae TaxID=58002 RepID=UPI0021A9EA9E|nr:kinesin-like protein KIF19 isoform X2 [Daktulosphaira vitifoliae]